MSSFETSFFGPAEETFNKFRDNNSNLEDNSVLKSSFKNLSSYPPIKSLIESPFKSQYIEDNLDNQGQNNEKNLLQRKIEAHQLRFFEENGNLNASPETLTKDTILHSAFKSRRMESLQNSNINNINTIKNVEKKKANVMNSSDVLLNDDFKAATSRLVNRGNEFKKILFVALSFLVYKLLRNLIRLIVFRKDSDIVSTLNYMSELFKGSNNPLFNFIGDSLKFEKLLATASSFEMPINIISILLIIQPLYLILKPNDDCLDLNLTNSQRKILNLPLLNDEDDNNENDKEIEKLIKFGNSLRVDTSSNFSKVKMPEKLDDVMGSLDSLVINRNNMHSGNITVSGIESSGLLKEKLNNRNSFKDSTFSSVNRTFY